MANNTAISICSAALLLIGSDEINSFQDETREAKVCGEVYSVILEDLLSRHPWKFCKGMVELTRLEDTPLFDYNYAFQLPSDMLEFSKIELPSPYEIYEDKLYCNLSEVNCVYQFRPSEHKFPPYFVRLLVYELCQDLSVSIAEDESKQDRFKVLAAEQEARARKLDSQQQPTRAIRQQNHVLVQVRRT